MKNNFNKLMGKVKTNKTIKSYEVDLLLNDDLEIDFTHRGHDINMKPVNDFKLSDENGSIDTKEKKSSKVLDEKFGIRTDENLQEHIDSGKLKVDKRPKMDIICSTENDTVLLDRMKANTVLEALTEYPGNVDKMEGNIFNTIQEKRFHDFVYDVIEHGDYGTIACTDIVVQALESLPDEHIKKITNAYFENPEKVDIVDMGSELWSVVSDEAVKWAHEQLINYGEGEKSLFDKILKSNDKEE